MAIAVIDYGIGNVQSVVNACARIDADTVRVTDGAALERLAPGKIVLPGVGAIGAALARLRERGFEPALRRLVLDRTVPFMGICVGMQMLAERCEEFGLHQGLGWIPGTVRRLGADTPDLRIPHVGWNSLHCTRGDDPILAPLDGQDFYFVHSYAITCEPAAVAATSRYGGDFVAAVRDRHILGVQFHPEKSSAAGAELIRRFLVT